MSGIANTQIEICGFDIWTLKGATDWDMFGWLGTGCRRILVDAIRAQPDREDELIRE